MSTCYIVSYDMAKNGDYNALFEAIKSYGIYAHITESTWAVVTHNNATAVRDHLNRYLPAGSRLFVVKSGVESAWHNVICNNEWLKRYL